MTRVTTRRRLSRASWLLLMAIGVMLIAVLYSVKTRALEAKAYVRKLENVLAQEQANVKILRAEIAHLESPARLSALSAQYLKLEPTAAKQAAVIALVPGSGTHPRVS